jgi:hypothetical protein
LLSIPFGLAVPGAQLLSGGQTSTERPLSIVKLDPALVRLELPILALIPGLGNVAWRPASDLR